MFFSAFAFQVLRSIHILCAPSDGYFWLTWLPFRWNDLVELRKLLENFCTKTIQSFGAK